MSRLQEALGHMLFCDSHCTHHKVQRCPRKLEKIFEMRLWFQLKK